MKNQDGLRDYLDEYIQTHGGGLPGDARRFAAGYDFGELCVLCGNQHDHNSVFIYNILNSSRKSTTYHSCDECEEVIQRELVSTHFPEFISRNNNVYTERDENTELRISMYNAYRKFDTSVYKHYMYLNEHRDLYTNKNTIYSCYFCKSYAPVKGSLKIEVPQDVSQILNGGIVLCCTECEYDIMKGATDLVESPHITVQCASCKQAYSVTQDEYSARVNYNTALLDKYMCPICTYAKINLLEAETSNLYIYQNEAPREEPISVLNWEICSACKVSVLLDLRLDHDYLERSYFYNDECHCEKCGTIKRLTGRANHNKYVAHINGNVYLVVFKQGKYWVYELIIYNFVTQQKTTVLKSDTERDLIETITIGMEEGHKYTASKQYELWNPPLDSE